MLRAVTILLCCCALAWACVAPDGGSGSERLSLEDGRPGRVMLVDYRSLNRLTLVNEAHTDPVAAYTEKRASASTKVTSNEVFQAMLDYFEEQGWGALARSGFAPSVGTGSMRWALEVETEDGGVQHLVVSLETPRAQMESALECKTGFIQIFNITQQSQAVENAEGRALFDEQQRDLEAELRDRAKGSGKR